MRIAKGTNETNETHWHGWIKAWPWESRFFRRLSWCNVYYNWKGHYFSIETDDAGLAQILVHYYKQQPLSRFTLVKSRQVGGVERQEQEKEVLACIGRSFELPMPDFTMKE